MNPTVCQNSLPFHPDRRISARFDGGKITSDAGLLLFYALDKQHRLSEGFSGCLGDAREESRICHQLLEMVRQRVHQIVAGYEDCNDADTLRGDPILKTICDRLPDSDPDLASQPTLSRLENAVGIKDLMRLGRWLLKRYIRRLRKRRPKTIVLDLDSTDDPTHGQQEFSFYHGYYRSHILHPLLIFDGDSGDLISAVLRPGNKGAAAHVVPVLRRVVAAIRKALPTVEIEIRADSGFATPQLYDFCEQEGLQYVIGLSRNPRLEGTVEPVLEQTRRQFEENEEKQREFGEFRYQAKTWKYSRRVVAKVEVNEVGINRRFVVTNRARPVPPAALRSLQRPRPDGKLHQGLQDPPEDGPPQLPPLLGQSVSFAAARPGLPDVPDPARLPLRNPLAKPGGGDSAAPDSQDRGPRPTDHTAHLDPLQLRIP